MKQPTTIDLLNKMLGIVSRSFQQYLKFSSPYVPPGRKETMGVLEAMVSDQDNMADRISQMIVDQQELPRTGGFPMGFTDMHDLDIDFLVRMTCGYQQQDIQSLKDLVDQLQLAPAAKSLAEETLGMAKGHLQTLQELVEEHETDRSSKAQESVAE